MPGIIGTIIGDCHHFGLLVMAELKDPAVCFSKEEQKILARDEKGLTVRNIPFHEAMQEGRRSEALYHKYGDSIRNESDIDPALLDSIPERAGAFAYCVAKIETVTHVGEDLESRYSELKLEGYAIRKESIARLEYIFRNDEIIQKALDNVKKGRGDLEMIKDNNSLYKITCDNKERVLAGKYPWALAQRQNEIYKELSSLAAEIDINPEKIAEAVLLGRKAWTHLWEALDEFFKAGRIVFYSEPDIQELFYVDYLQRNTKKKTAQELEEPIPEMTA